ncbi:hypothetical protein IQ266_23155, partial [filamentous cyanobacterium LEGE 11480]
MEKTSPGPTPAQIADNIALLYELSLAIGGSLDLHENCDQFVRKLMSRQNLGFFGLYLNTALRQSQDPSRLPRPTDKYHTLYTCPNLTSTQHELAGDSKLVLKTNFQQVLCAPCDDFSDATIADITGNQRSNHHQSSGILSAFSIDHGRAIIIVVNQVRPTCYARWELQQLHMLLEKFSRSVEACLNHADLRQETMIRIDLEQRLAGAQRMESLGLLAGGIAHDLGNILNPLSVYPDILMDYLPPDSPGQNMLQKIERAVHQATDMMQDLVALARTGGGRTEVIKLDRPVGDYFESPPFLALQAKHPQIQCEWQLNTQAQVRAGASMIHRITLNLVGNAFEELDGTGQIKVQVFDQVQDQEYYGYELIPAGCYTVLQVQDNGTGIAAEDQSHIFEPFFSKKSLGRSGSGLGLAVVYGIVKDLDGFVDLQTSEAGTAFILYFP